MTDLATQTPLEIDTALSELYAAYGNAQRQVEQAIVSILHAAGARRLYGRGRAQWNMTTDEAIAVLTERSETDETYVGREATQRLTDYAAAKAVRAEIQAQMGVLGAEYNRRPWTRAYLVTDGHVHSSMDCSTCNNGEYATQFTWMVDLADHDEAEIIAKAADRACTVCYPHAPVVAAGTSTLMTPEERTRAQQREDAAKAKADRLAKKIANGLTEDGSEFVVSHPGYNGSERTEYFKTERAAVQWLVQYSVWGSHGSEDYTPAFDAIKQALCVKHSMTMEQVEAMLDEKIAAKRKRDGL